MIKDIVRYSSKHFLLLFKYLESVGITINPICSTGIPNLKRELYEERAIVKRDLERNIRALGNNILSNGVKDGVLSLVKRYALCFRDDIRDGVVENVGSNFFRTEEADKTCGRFPVIMSEDVDIFLFGNKKTIIVKPFINSSKHFDFIDCESYYVDKGIKSHADFVQVAFLIGTDYNRGIKGIGPKRAIAAIAKYRTIEKFVTTKYDDTVTFLESFGKFERYL